MNARTSRAYFHERALLAERSAAVSQSYADRTGLSVMVEEAAHWRQAAEVWRRLATAAARDEAKGE